MCGLGSYGGSTKLRGGATLAFCTSSEESAVVVDEEVKVDRTLDEELSTESGAEVRLGDCTSSEESSSKVQAGGSCGTVYVRDVKLIEPVQTDSTFQEESCVGQGSEDEE